MIEGVFDTIEKAIDIVDQAVTSQDYSQMSKQINDLFHPKTGDNLYRDVRDRYPDSRYRAGHMEKSKSTVRQEPPAWAKHNPPRGTPGWAQGGSGSSRSGAQTVNRNPQPYTVRGRQTAAGQKAFNAGQAAGLKNRQVKKPVYIQEPSSLSGILMTVFGAAGVAGALPTALIALTDGSMLSFLAGIIGLVITAGFGFMAVKGIGKLRTLKRLAVYKELLGTKLYAEVKDLASAVNKPVAKVVSEIRKLMAENVFPQGHFDKTEQTFMATDAIYQNYLDTEARAEKLRQQQEAEDAAYADLPPEARRIVKKGKVYVDEINEANANIPDPVVTGKLNRMEAIVTRIFTEVREKPELAGRLTMLMEYYLPTTGKLLKAYRDMSEQPIQGENIRTAKAEIENSLDTINDAFERLLDSFFEDEAIDLSTDISVMKHVMKQEGLTESELKAEKPASEDAMWENGPTLADLSEAIREQEKQLVGGEKV